MKEQIQQLEEQLNAALVGAKLDVLETLVSDNFIFTDHMGVVHSKAEELALHASKYVDVQSIVSSGKQIIVTGQTAVVSDQVDMQGEYDSIQSSSVFKSTRVWGQVDSDNWQLLAIHMTLLDSTLD